MKKKLVDNDIVKNMRKKDPKGRLKPLINGFYPGQNDVICSRGKVAREHQGNVRFRASIIEYLEEYKMAESKAEKSRIVGNIMKKVRKNSLQGGFVKEISGVWYEVGDNWAREKVGQSLRDLLFSRYRSSTKAKRRYRWEEQAKVDNQIYDILHQPDCRNIINSIKRISDQKCNDTNMQNQFNEANCRLLNIFKAKSNKYIRNQFNQANPKFSNVYKGISDEQCSRKWESTACLDSSSLHSFNLEPIPLNKFREFDYHSNLLHFTPFFQSIKYESHQTKF